MQHFILWNESAYSTAFDPTHVIPRDIEEWKSHQQTVEKVRPNTLRFP